jgi:hypothetical protein
MLVHIEHTCQQSKIYFLEFKYNYFVSVFPQRQFVGPSVYYIKRQAIGFNIKHFILTKTMFRVQLEKNWTSIEMFKSLLYILILLKNSLIKNTIPKFLTNIWKDKTVNLLLFWTSHKAINRPGQWNVRIGKIYPTHVPLTKCCALISILLSLRENDGMWGMKKVCRKSCGDTSMLNAPIEVFLWIFNHAYLYNMYHYILPLTMKKKILKDFFSICLQDYNKKKYIKLNAFYVFFSLFLYICVS